MADGTLIFDTKIDTSGLNKGTQSATKVIGKFRSALLNFGKAANESFMGVSSKVMDMENKIQKTENEIKSLTQSMEEMANKQVESKTVIKLKSDIEKANEKLAVLDGKASEIAKIHFDNLASSGFEDNGAIDNILAQDSAYQKLQSQIRDVESALERYRVKLAEAEAQGGVTAGSQTVQYQAKQQKVQELTGKLDVYKTKLREIQTAEQQAGKGAGAFGSAMSNAEKQTGKLTKSLSGVKKMMLGMFVFKAIYAILNAVKEGMQNLAQASPSVNADLSQLMSALTQLKNALATAFAPILSIVTPVLTWLINLLTKAADAIAKFFTLLTGQKSYKKAIAVQEDYASSLENTREEAKKNEKTVASFDELNSVGDKSSSGGSGSTKTSPSAMYETVAVGVDTSPLELGLLQSMAKLSEAFTPLKETISNGLMWLYANVLKPLGEWTIGEALPSFINVLSGVFSVLNSVLIALKPLGLWLWEKFLQPIAKWTGGVIISVLDGVALALGKVSDWITTHQKTVEVIAIIIGSFAAAWGLVNVAILIWNVIGGIATAVTSAFGAAVAFLTSPIGIVVIAIGALIAIIVLCVKYWDEIKAAAVKCWEAICGAFKAVGQWFKTNVVDPIVKCFQSVWDKISYGAKLAWYGIKLGAVSMVNFVISAINLWIKGVLAPFNLLIKGLNYIPGVKIQKLEFEIPKIKLPDPPKLATGTVVPANYGEFLATLGDNRREPEVVSPLSTMKQAFKEALAESGGNRNDRPLTVVLKVGTREFAKVCVESINELTRSTGELAIDLV